MTFFSEIVVQIWRSRGYDSAKVVYIYSTSPGVLMLTLRFVTCAWFCYCCSTTMRSFTTKKKFFTKFSVGFGGWLLLKPVLAAFCSASFLDTERFKFMVAFECCLMFTAQSVLIVMYVPDFKFNRGFPFPNK